MLGFSVKSFRDKKGGFFQHEKQNQNGQKAVGACFVAADDCHGCADDGGHLGGGGRPVYACNGDQQL